MLGVAGVFNRPRALPQCTDAIGVVSSSQCFKPVRTTPLHLFRSLTLPSYCGPSAKKVTTDILPNMV